MWRLGGAVGRFAAWGSGLFVAASWSACSGGSDVVPPSDNPLPSQLDSGPPGPSTPGDTPDAGDGSLPDAQGPLADQPAGLPAEVCSVLQNNGCTTCHQSSTQGGAPMSLQLRADFTGASLDGTSMAQTLLARVQDPNNPMPPPSTARPLMPAEDLAVLQQWVDAGLPGAEAAPCAAPEAGLDGPGWASKGWPGDRCEWVLRVGAHGANGVPLADDDTPFEVPADETYYHCFYEKVPWGDTPVQALAVRAIVDTPADEKYVHHMVLSSLGPDDGTSVAGGERPTMAGQQQPCDNPNGSTMGVWAPGALGTLTLPDGVGLKVPSDTAEGDAYIELQVHYNNPTGDVGHPSRTAFDICVTSDLGEQTAGVHWLGYENADDAIVARELFGPLVGEDLLPKLDNQGGGVGQGVCTAKERTRVLWVTPHMHELGRHAKMEVLRNDGSVEVIHDEPFTFEEQTAYMFEELWIEPGEQIRTTCTWDTSRPAVFGFASDEEMCFAYTLAYPAGSLAGEGSEKGIVGGDLSCAGGGDL